MSDSGDSSVRPRFTRHSSGESQMTEDTQKETFQMEKAQVTSWRRILLLIIAITVHNIPEGLAVGVGFGAIGRSSTATFESARYVLPIANVSWIHRLDFFQGRCGEGVKMRLQTGGGTQIIQY